MAGKTVADAVSKFGASVKPKLANPAISGEPEDQLRGPLETLVRDLAEVGGLPANSVRLVGETPDADQDASGFCGDRQQGSRRLHRSQGAGQGRRPAQVQRSARQGAMGQAQVAAEPDLHRRQCVQPLARRQACKARSSISRAMSRRPGAKLAAPPTLLPLISDFLQWKPISAEERKAARADQRAPVPASARRGGRADGARQSRPHRARAGLAQAPVSSSGRRRSSPTATRRR